MQRDVVLRVRVSESVRWWVRLLVLALAVLVMLPFGDVTRPMAYAVAASPFVALSATIAGRSLALVASVGLVVLIVVSFRRRFFCRWLCPTGVCTDAASRLGQRLRRRRPVLPAAGRWIALVTLGGALLGYPLLLWLDPLALFSGLFTIPQAGSSWWTWITLGAVPLLVVSSFFWPDVWCLRLCPLGGLQDLLAIFTRPWRRTGDAEAERSSQLVLGRRALVGSLLGLAWAGLARRVRGTETVVMRPPGAAPGGRFEELCLRCGSCIRICPASVLAPDLGTLGVTSFLSPVLTIGDDYCREDCVRCTEVCPSGAIGRVCLSEKISTPVGLAQVDYDVCLLSDDRECSECRNHCPFEAVRAVFSEETYSLKVLVDPDRCPGCGACQVACPTDPKSIFVTLDR